MTSTKSFSSWTKSGSGTLSRTTYTFAAGNGTLTANYTNNSITLPNATRTGYQFAGWYTAASGGERKGGNGSSYTPTAATTLYAQWTANTYTIKFNSNGGSGSMSNLSMTYGTAKNLTTNAFTKTGYTFVGWSTSSTATSATYTNGQSVNNLTATNGGTVTLYALWKKTITITYNANGGSGAPSSQTATVYNSTTSYTFTLSTTKPTRSGYIFEGWADSSTSTTASYEPGSTLSLSANKTLYAVWTLAVAQIDNTLYPSLVSAVNAAPDNVETTILLLVNRSEAQIDIPSTKKLFINLRQKTLECCLNNHGNLTIGNGSMEISASYGKGYAINNSGTLTIIDGAYTMKAADSDRWTIVNNPNCQMTIQEGTFNNEGTGTCIYNKGNMTMNGGTVNASGTSTTYGVYGIVTAASNGYSAANSIIKDVKIYSNNIGIQSGNGNSNPFDVGYTRVYNSYIKGTNHVGVLLGDKKSATTLILYDCTISGGSHEGNVTEVKTDSNGYDVYVYNIQTTITLICPTYTTANGQDDMTWENATNMGNYKHHYRVDKSRHNNETGEYITVIYRWENGEIISGWQVFVDVT